MRNEVSQRIQQWYYSDAFLWFIIGIGLFLRLNRYFHNPSLWFDEAGLAVDIITRPLTDFVHPSTNIEQTSPLGFLFLVKLSVQAFGNSEYALRLYAVLSGVISLFLFHKVAKHYITPKAVPLALGLFILSDPLVYYSSELKTYSGDMTIALLLYTIVLSVQGGKVKSMGLIMFGLVGSLAIWFSHPSAFVLAGIGTVLAVSSFKKKEWKKTGNLVTIYSFWALSFFVNYFLYTRPLMSNFGNTFLFMKKNNAIMPFPPMSLKDIEWYMNTFFKIFDFPVGLTLTGIAALAFLLGVRKIFSEKKEIFFMLLLPVFFTLLASSVQMYAIQGRLILFLVPTVLLFLAEGLEYVRSRTSPASVIIGTGIIGLLFLHPLAWSAYHAVNPDSREEIKPVLSYIKDNWQTGDAIYVYYMSINAFEYYNNHHPGNYFIDDDAIIIGRAPRDWYATYRKKEFTGFWNEDRPFMQPYAEILREYTEDLSNLSGRKRVWFLFSTTVPKAGILEENFYLYFLDSFGEKKDFFGRVGNASAYLYDLSGTVLNAEDK